MNWLNRLIRPLAAYVPPRHDPVAATATAGRRNAGVTGHADQQPAPPEESAPLSLEQILLGYQAGTLAQQTDPVLHRAALTLEAAQRNFWTDIDTRRWTLDEITQARALRQHYAEIEHFILNLLNTRYGCND